MSENHSEYLNKIPTASGKILFLDAETADVYFAIGSEDRTAERIPAHKNLLAAGKLLKAKDQVDSF